MASIKVAVRVRPISSRESSFTGSEVVVRTELTEISLTNLKVSPSKVGDSRERTRRYGFDYCFDSSDPEAKNYANQATIYETLGQSILDAMFSGYNTCLVAYGQSASGKTYTMMGTQEDPGLIPRLCEGLFSRVADDNEQERIYRVTVSYLEIYNERVRDLLKPSTSVSGLRVREHPRLGPYVQGLTHHVVRTLGSLMSYVEEGTKARKTASTLQNPNSSRSHALLTVALSQETSDAERPGGGFAFSSREDCTPRDGSSRLHLVDLAGSESAATCGGVHRLKEGASINRSLVALGNVISALAEKGPNGSGPSRRYIPYRNSSLTWLLKDALGGNATTIMLATISPASGSYNETAHTLRFAQRAQSVVNRPVVNEDPVARLIRELRAEVARLKSLLFEQDINQQTNVSCCCGKIEDLKDPKTDLQYREEQRSDFQDQTVELKNNWRDILPIRRINSCESVTTYETGSSTSIRKFSSYEHLQPQDRFVDNYNQAKVTELNDEEDEAVDEINEPVFVDIPTLVAVLIKPDNSLQESTTQIEEICSDEVQEDPIDADFIERRNNGGFEGSEKINDIDLDNIRTSKKLPTDEFYQILSESTARSPLCDEKKRVRGAFAKQNSVDLSSSNLSVSKFGSIETISKRKEPIFGFQRSQTNLEKRPTLPDRVKKLNNISEIDDRKANIKSGNIWRAIGNTGSKDHLQRKSSNDSDKSLKDSNSSKSGYSSIGRKPSLESLKRKTSKDSSSSSSKEEQIVFSNLARDELSRRKGSLDQEGNQKNHTVIQRAKRAEIVAAVTERLYTSRKHTEETSMATNTSGTRSPPEGTDVKVSASGFAARSKLQEISRKMLLRRRRINVDTQTETASTMRLKDTACLTDEPKIVLRDAAVLTDNHANCDMFVTKERLPVLRVKDAATLTDRPRTQISRCKDAESSTNDLHFDDYEIHSPRNDSGILSDDTQNYAESNLSTAEVSEFYPEGDRRVPCTDNSTNTFFLSPGRNSAVQTQRQEFISQRKNANYREYCNVIHEPCQRASTNNTEKNVISISLPDMISITIESMNSLESRIAVTDGSDFVEERPKSRFSDKEAQTIEQTKNEEKISFLKDYTMRSTAVQADGRTFRIENIFQDPRNKSCIDESSDVQKNIAIRKSIVFRNSLGTYSAIDAKENDTGIKWDKMQFKESCQRKRLIPRGNLTRAFIAKRHGCSLCPRKPRYKLARYDLWKNLTISCPTTLPGLTDYAKDTITVSLPAQQDINSIDLSPSTVNNKCIFDDKICEETFYKSSTSTSKNKFEDLTLKDLYDSEPNFSDDSLDYDEDNIKRELTDLKSLNVYENYENLCPPDVVAHTSKSASHTDSLNTESSIDHDFEASEVKFLKDKFAEISDKNVIHNYKSLILGSSYVEDNGPEEGDVVRTPSLSDNTRKKKVSFSNLSNSREENDALSNDKDLAPKKSLEIPLKSIVKKRTMHVAENLDIIQLNEADQLVQQRKATLTNPKIPSTSKGNQDSENVGESLVNSQNIESSKIFANACSESSSVNKDEDIDCREVPQGKFLEKYLNEAMTFMRNMNSINEYMNATNMFDGYRKYRRRRVGLRGNNLCIDRNYRFPERKINLKDDKYLQSDNDEIVPVESYEKCLKGIEKLEACIDKVNKHNQVLRDRYGIDVESLGVKSSLASPKVDYEIHAITKNGTINQSNDTIYRNDINEPDPSWISASSLSSTQSDVTKQSRLNETEEPKIITKVDNENLDDKKNNFTSDDDLERRIFDQLMDVADSTIYWSMRKLRQRSFCKMSDLKSRSPTTYSKFRETFRQNARGILNLDKVPAVEDYLSDIRGMESSSQNFRKTKLFESIGDVDSWTSIGFRDDSEESSDLNKLPIENSNLLEMEIPNELANFETKVEDFDYLKDYAKLSQTGMSYEDENVEQSIGTQDSLKIDWTNPEFRGSFSTELKYPGSPRAKFLELLRERRRIVENSRGTNAF